MPVHIMMMIVVMVVIMIVMVVTMIVVMMVVVVMGFILQPAADIGDLRGWIIKAAGEKR